MEVGYPIVSSWSGGKDSCLALYQALQGGASPVALLTMLQEDGRHSRSHGLPLELLQAQADAMSIPLVTRATSWETYEETFIGALKELRAAGAQGVVFGDIDIEEHREWECMVCRAANLDSHLPLWSVPRAALLEAFWSAGFEATVVAANDEKLGPAHLGRRLSPSLALDLEQAGVDLCGEAGEYHTVVTDGPIFSRPLPLQLGAKTLHAGYWFVEATIA